MKTVILCGGKGTRLAEETEYRPKPLVEIGGKPILWHIMKIYEYHGFKDFVLCLGHKGNMIKDYFINLEYMANSFMLDMGKKKTEILGNHHGLDGKIWFIDTGQNSMTGSRVAKIKQYLGDDEDFFLTYGDGVADVNLNSLYEHNKNSTGKRIIIHDFHMHNQFGIATLRQTEVLIVEFLQANR